jgi:outer membrane protein assembly factor BamB
MIRDFFTALAITTGAGWAMAGGAAMADDWPQWRGPNRDAKSTETGLYTQWDADGPPLAYKTEGIGQGYAGVSVADGKVFTTGNQQGAQVVTAIDEANGKILWQTPITSDVPSHGYEGSRSTPTISEGLAYVVASSGAIVCLQTSDGSEVWRRPFSDWNGQMMSGWGFSESPLVDGDRVICTPGGPSGMVVALDKRSGDQIWACQLPDYGNEQAAGGKDLKDGAGYSSAIITEGGGVKQYVQLVGRGLVGIRARDGKLLWRYDRVANGTANIPTPIATGDYVFASTAYGTGSALLKLQSDGKDNVKVEEVYWLDSNQLQNKHGGMVLVDGYIYCGTGNGDGRPICVELKSGDVAWGPVRGEGRGESSVVYADGHVIYRRDNGTVMLVKATPDEFQVVQSFDPEYQEGKSWAHPVVAGGRLYLREQDTLMVYKLR